MFINIGNKAFVNADKVKFIVGADAEKVRRELAKHGMTRTDKEVYDGTSAKETRSMLIMDDNTVGISSVNSTVLANRANIAFSEKESKAMLDLVSSMMLASSLGIGVLLSSVAVFIIQGGLVLLAGLISPLMSTGAINEMTCAGSILIIMIGTNLMGITKIKVADFLPAILFAPIIHNIVPLFEKLWNLFA